MDFVAKFNVKFPLFEKADVNGAHTRPVFAFLKSKLHGSFGNFIKWNFTKFLIGKDGQPVSRFGPKEPPFSFEAQIQQMLEKEDIQ